MLHDLSEIPPNKQYIIPSFCGIEFNASRYSWLSAQFLSIDANFQMKCKDVSSQEADPGLNDGCAYFVEEKAYKTWLNGHKDEVQEGCPP
jgi:hypothetical protein